MEINAEEYFPNVIQQTQNNNIVIDGLATEESREMFSGDMSDIEVWLKYKKFKLQKDNEDSERKLREENAKKAFWFAAVWATFIAIFIFLHALKSIKIPFLLLSPNFAFISTAKEFKFILTEVEFLFVCGTLTASILIFYLTVIKNLFPNKPENAKRLDSPE